MDLKIFFSVCVVPGDNIDIHIITFKIDGQVFIQNLVT